MNFFPKVPKYYLLKQSSDNTNFSIEVTHIKRTIFQKFWIVSNNVVQVELKLHYEVVPPWLNSDYGDAYYVAPEIWTNG